MGKQLMENDLGFSDVKFEKFFQNIILLLNATYVH